MKSTLCASLLFAAGLSAQAGPSVMVPADATADRIVELAATVTPSPRQFRWLGLEFTAFVHFGMNTFTDREWGEGKEDAALFDPKDLDARQWCRTFRDAGMRGLVLTCKHHDGFCLWPTKTTEHSVKNAPWKDGKGDVVAEVAAACREHNLAFGVYLSPWDRHEPKYGTPEYQKFFLDQLRELLTGYGPIHDVWFDGANAPRDDRSKFDWTAVWKLVRELQPEACISVMGPDVRWCGNEAGATRDAEWNVVPLDTADDREAQDSWEVAQALFRLDPQARDLGSRAKLGGCKRLVWWPAMTDTSIRPGWFWHAGDNGQVKSLPQLVDLYERAVGGGTQLLLNVPPDKRGLIHEVDAQRLHDLGAVLRATFGTAISDGARIKDFGTVRELWFTEPRTADLVALAEDVANSGQRVERFRIDAWDGNAWFPVADGSTIGQKRFLRFDPVTATAFRVWIERSRGKPTLASFALHRRAKVLAAPVIARDRSGMVSIGSAPGTVVRYTTDGSPVGDDAPVYQAAFPFVRGGVIRAKVSPEPGSGLIDLGIATEASTTFGLAPTRWKILSCDSEQAPSEAAECAIDGDPTTHWHSRWSPDSPNHPHRIAIDLGTEQDVTGFTYLPRHEGSNGTVTRYDFRVSIDGSTWTTAIEGGEFGNIEANPVQQVVRLPNATRARYVELVSHRAVGDRPWASAAEIGVLVQ
ncbi:MAG: alpha-L-fucosidase [Planctomycetota bacterium]